MERKSHPIQMKDFLLTHLLAPGPMFRIGHPCYKFSLAENGGDCQTHVCQEHALRVQTRLDFSGSAVIVSSVLENFGTVESQPIEAVEPLYLEFASPFDTWKHLFANGGTDERLYPPVAYRTREFASADEPLVIGSDEGGRSSNRTLPLLMSTLEGGGFQEGLFCGMEWSGAWYIRFEPGERSRSALRAGIQLNSIRLAPGESIDLPSVHVGFFTGDFDEGTNALRSYLYEHVCARYQGERVLPRVSYDHWFGIDNKLNIENMKREVDRAAELGVEVFVVDAAWFIGDFPEGVGNYQVNRQKFPGGLEELSDYAGQHGLGFGLWFEPERVVEGTSLALDHPDWIVEDPVSWCKKKCFHLNLARTDVQDFLIDLIGGFIQRYNLKWSRWDYNINPMPFWSQADPTLKIQFEYFKGLYRVLDTLMQRYPDWMVEGCASGGRRIDIGTIKRAHTFWFSDQTDIPANCRYMQARANRFLPGHLLNSSVAVGLNKGDDGFDDTAILSRMLGKLAFDGDIASWSPGLTARYSQWVRLFKEIRHLLVQDFYQLAPLPAANKDWDVVEFASYGHDEAIIFAFAGSDGDLPLDAHLHAHTFMVKGLDAASHYDVFRCMGDGRASHPGDHPGSLSGGHPGAGLMTLGMEISLRPGEAGLWRVIRKK
jgi:alpha-galactosidase